jgi:hypothetical protein
LEQHLAAEADVAELLTLLVDGRLDGVFGLPRAALQLCAVAFRHEPVDADHHGPGRARQ